MCHLPAKQSRAFTVFRSDSKHLCDVGLGYKTLAGNNYSKVQGSRFHAYADRSFTARWRWCIREYVGKMQSTLSQKLLWSLQFSKLKQAEKKNMRLRVNNRLVESIVHMFTFACISRPTIVVRTFFVESILHVRTVFTMSQHLV